MANLKEKVEVITVASPSNMRANAGYVPAKIGKVETVPARYKNMPITLGGQGKMLKSDYEARNFAPYGLKETDVLIRGEINSLVEKQLNSIVEEKSKLEEENAELRRKLEAAISEQKPKKEEKAAGDQNKGGGK